MRFLVSVAFFLIILGVAGLVWLWPFNLFNKVERDFEGVCTPFSGLPGPEDIQVDVAGTFAVVSSYDRRGEAARGAIHIINLSDLLHGANFRDRTGSVPVAFQPLGISLFEAGNVRRLFVVNAATNAIELFDMDAAGDLNHVDTITDNRLTSPNNIVAVAPGEFYVTNDVHPGRETLLGQFHFLARHGSGEVFHYNDGAMHVAASELRFANGVAINGAGTALYVAETAANTVRVFQRDPASGKLGESREIQLKASPDNLVRDNDDNIWVAAIPKPLMTPRVRSNPVLVAPSKVYKISRTDVVNEIYSDPGDELSASTVAAPYSDKMLIGSLFDAKFLICQLP